MREVEVVNLPGSIITDVQLCCMSHNQYQLIASSQAQATLSCMQVDDAAASQAVLAETLAAMQVRRPGIDIAVLLLAKKSTSAQIGMSHVVPTQCHYIALQNPHIQFKLYQRLYSITITSLAYLNAGATSQDSSSSRYSESSGEDGTGSESGSFSSSERLSERLTQSRGLSSSDPSSDTE